MEKISTWTFVKPLIVGWSASTWWVIVSFMQWVTPYLQFASLTVGLTIWVITLHGLIKKIINQK